MTPRAKSIEYSIWWIAGATGAAEPSRGNGSKELHRWKQTAYKHGSFAYRGAMLWAGKTTEESVRPLRPSVSIPKDIAGVIRTMHCYRCGYPVFHLEFSFEEKVDEKLIKKAQNWAKRHRCICEPQRPLCIPSFGNVLK